MKGTRFGPLVSAGVLMGMGMGGFLDGIVFHQLLQTHNMLSAQTPPDTLVRAKVNMFWDGVFHAGVWALTALGLVRLIAAGARPDVAWSGRAFLGSWLAGWGLFNFVEGLIDHQILGLHHVLEYADPSAQALADYAFLATGPLFGLIGWTLVRSAKAAWRRKAALAAQGPSESPSSRPYMS